MGKTSSESYEKVIRMAPKKTQPTYLSREMKAAGLAKYLHSQCWVYPEVKMSGSPHKKGDLDKEGRTASCSPSMPTGPINAVAVCRLLYTTLLRKGCWELFSVHFVLKKSTNQARQKLREPGNSSGSSWTVALLQHCHHESQWLPPWLPSVFPGRSKLSEEE